MVFDLNGVAVSLEVNKDKLATLVFTGDLHVLTGLLVKIGTVAI
jgi:hypothetical protein